MEEINHSEQQALFKLDEDMESETTISDGSNYSEDGSYCSSDIENLSPAEVDSRLHEKYYMVARLNIDPKDYNKLLIQLDNFLNDFECATGMSYSKYRKWRSNYSK